MGVVGRRLRQLADAQYARQVQRLFKTGPGDYGEGDIFIGVRVPAVRALAKEHGGLGAREVCGLIRSEIHEERLLGLLILLEQYQLAEQAGNCSRQLALYRIYCGHFRYINNWDLVDATCPHIVGKYLCNRPHGVLLEWARHRHLWTRRIAVVSTWWFIRQGQVNTTLRVAHCLVNDQHDLIHKAVGWMLREAAKRDFARVDEFLSRHHRQMPRVMLRSAIERFTKGARRRYL